MELLFKIVVGALVALLAWFGNRLWERMDKADDRQNAMQLACVTQAVLDRRLDEMKTDRLAMHKDNKESLTKIEDSVNSIDDTVRNLALQVATLVPPTRRSRN